MTNYLKIGPIVLLNPTDFIDGVIGKDDSGKALKGPDGKPIKFLRVFSVSGRRYDFKEPEAQLVRDFLTSLLTHGPNFLKPEREFEPSYTNNEGRVEYPNGSNFLQPLPESPELPKLQIHKIKETIEKRGTE